MKNKIIQVKPILVIGILIIILLLGAYEFCKSEAASAGKRDAYIAIEQS